jgi:hypothetical protein
VRAAVLGEPTVVSVHARLLVVQVRMAAEHEADRRVEHLGADAVAILVRETCLGIPAAAVPLLEVARHSDVLGALARGRDEAHGERALRQVRDHVHVAARLVADEMWRPVPERWVDMLPVRVGVLGDVGVGRDHRLRHGCLLCDGTSTPCQAADSRCRVHPRALWRVRLEGTDVPLGEEPTSDAAAGIGQRSASARVGEAGVPVAQSEAAPMNGHRGPSTSCSAFTSRTG